MAKSEARGRKPDNYALEIIQRQREDQHLNRIVEALGFRKPIVQDGEYVDMWADDCDASPVPLTWICQSSSFIGGTTGKGKTNTVEAILASMAKMGIGFSVIDQENEYFPDSVASRFGVMRIDAKRFADNDEIIKKLAITVVLQSKRVVIYFTGMSQYEKCDFLLKYMRALYWICDKLEPEEKIPHILCIDEGSNFFPQRMDSSYDKYQELNNEASLATRAGRKRGLAFMVATQSMKDIQKAPLRQMDNKIFHGVSDASDIMAYIFVLKRSGERGMTSWAFRVFPKMVAGELYFIRGSHIIFGRAKYMPWHVSVTPNPYKRATQAQLKKYSPDLLDLEAMT
ncbi:MAG: DUF87 domain-containing protein [Candidatus Micrarchaeia archaeon]|jgi:hypothetical protein